MAGNGGTILFVHCADEWYGSDYVLHEIVRSLEGTEFDALVLVPSDGASDIDPSLRLSGRLRAMGVPVQEIKLTVLRRRYMTPRGSIDLWLHARSTVRAAIAAVGARRIALVHSHTAAVLTGASVARALGVPHVWHVSEIVERPRIVRAALARHISRRSDAVVAVSHAVRDHLIASQPSLAPKTRVIHNAVDAARFAAPAQAAPGQATAHPGGLVGMLGRVGTWKGQELLLHAAQLVLRELPDTRFVLAGGVLDGNANALVALRELAGRLGVADRVVIQEYCDDAPALLRSLDVFVQPSTRPDPLPTTILEAMASERPVIATAHGGAPEMVQHDVTGLLTPPGDAAALARAIVRLLRDRAARERMGRAGRDRVLREFSPAAFSAAYLDMYRGLAAAPRPPAP